MAEPTHAAIEALAAEFRERLRTLQVRHGVLPGLLERLEAKGGRTAAASSAAEEAADADEVLHMCSDLLNVLVTTAGEIAASQHQPHDWSA